MDLASVVGQATTGMFQTPWSGGTSLFVLASAVVIDLALGEPPTPLHPVVWLGRLQAGLRRGAPRHPAGAFLWGLGMALLGPVGFAGGCWFLLRVLPGPLSVLVGIFFLKSSFAIRGLSRAAGDVNAALKAHDLPGARHALRSLVSRDTSSLPPSLLAAAAIESLGENTSDSVVGPLLCFAIGGVPAAVAYRAINTLDSMIGYRGETEWLGKAAARLDDVVNLIPARLTALLTIVVSGPARRSAAAVWSRDRGKTESPNAGHAMAAFAGALGVVLEKRGLYQLGLGLREPEVADIERAIRLYARVVLIFILGVGIALSGWPR